MNDFERTWAPASRARAALFGAAAILVAACSAAGGGAENEAVGTTGAAATAFANDQAAYDYFAGKGLTNFQAAAIVGNLDQESGVNPAAVQSGGPGRGIAQWSVGGRWDTAQGDNLVAYAAAQSQSATSLDVQLDFIWFELQTFSDYGLTKLRATTNVTDATVAFETDFEGCAACDEAARVAYAKDVLKAYGATPVVVDAGVTADAARENDAMPPAPAEDGGAPVHVSDSGATGDAGGQSSLDASTGSSNGCATASPGGAGSGRGGWWLVAIGLFVVGSQRRTRRT